MQKGEIEKLWKTFGIEGHPTRLFGAETQEHKGFEKRMVIERGKMNSASARPNAILNTLLQDQILSSSKYRASKVISCPFLTHINM